VGHQEGVREPRRCARQGEDLIQFGIAKSDYLKVEDHIAFKLIHRMCTISDLDVLHMHEMLRR
jgi:hypothetical protein